MASGFFFYGRDTLGSYGFRGSRLLRYEYLFLYALAVYGFLLGWMDYLAVEGERHERFGSGLRLGRKGKWLFAATRRGARVCLAVAERFLCLHGWLSGDEDATEGR